jgi:pyridoxamine 5'-phosphate oxidase
MNFDSPPSDPIALLNEWIEDARRAGIPNPNAMTLATIDAPPDGKPSVRIVLLKGLDSRGAVFYTNRLSRKGEALSANPRAALLFHWDPLNRQVRIEGDVTPTSDAESDAYFATRPRESQLGAWASRQSQPVANRAELDRAYAEMEKRFTGAQVPRPPHWGGYRVSLNEIEFWQGQEFRLHDRVVYTPDARGSGRGGWCTQRLYP